MFFLRFMKLIMPSADYKLIMTPLTHLCRMYFLIHINWTSLFPILGLICCWLLLPLWDSVIVLCFVVRYFVSILVLQSSWRESWFALLSLPGVLWWLSGSSSPCHRVVCSLWLWYFLIILTILLGVFFSFKFQKILLFTKRGQPDQTPHFAASDLVLHCLPMSQKDARLIWVNEHTKNEIHF